MPNKIKEAIADSLQDIVNAGIKTTFTQKRLNELGVKIPKTKMNLIKIKKVRKNLNLSQSVFAQVSKKRLQCHSMSQPHNHDAL